MVYIQPRQIRRQWLTLGTTFAVCCDFDAVVLNSVLINDIGFGFVEQVGLMIAGFSARAKAARAV